MSLILSFDIGYASIGWCVLSAKEKAPALPDILGTGVVTFPTDDCLASTRRNLRRTRRHIRSTRQRIERMKLWLLHRGVLTRAELDKPGHPAPFLLAAAALQGHRTLNAWELWTVLRWYGHNRGYDGNSRWANDEEDSEDTEKVLAANALMEKHGTATMCETVCKCLELDPAKSDIRISSALPYKTLNAAYPRKVVTAEVSQLLSKHIGKIPGLDAETVRFQLKNTELDQSERAKLEAAGIKLTKRYSGGLLFGQLVPRFDNRIIARCPITWAKVYDIVSKGLLCEEGTCSAWDEFLRSISQSIVTSEKAQFQWAKLSAKKLVLIQKGGMNEVKAIHQIASEVADKFAKVPAVKSKEFLEFRFASILANLRANDLPLSGELRRHIFKLATARGGFTPKELEKEIYGALGKVPTNLDAYFNLHPDSHKALLLDPATKVLHSSLLLKPLLSVLGDAVKAKALAQWRNNRSVRLGDLITWTQEGRSSSLLLESALTELHQKDRLKGKRKDWDFDSFLGVSIKVEDLSGRAPYARPVLRQAVEEILSGPFDPRKANKACDPVKGDEKPANGVLYDLGIPTSRVRQLQNARPVEQLTNNHLVRHRMLILDLLLVDILAEFITQDAPVQRVIVEVARELRDFSGKDITEIRKELTNRLKNFKAAVDKLKADAPHLPVSPNLIRKCRIAMDQGWRCPYTMKDFEATVLPSLTFDHIIPHATRKTDALHAMVLTPDWVNKLKGKRTATQFIEDMADDDRFVSPDKFKKWAEEHGPLKRPSKEFFRPSKKFPHIDDAIRCHNRRKLLLIKSFEDKELGFTEGQLTQTSQLVKLAMRSVKNKIPHAPCDPIPGAVTAEIRKSWNILGCLGAPNVCGNEVMRWVRVFDERDKNWSVDTKGCHPAFVKSEITVIKPKKGKSEEQLPPGILRCPNDECATLLNWPVAADSPSNCCTTSKATCPACLSVLRKVPKPKDEIRELTHLHHALDAATLALAAHYFPLSKQGHDQKGNLWSAMLKRGKTAEETRLLLSTGQYKATSRPSQDGSSRSGIEMVDLLAEVKNTLVSSLAESRVMQHIPSDRSGTKAELLTWGIVAIVGESALIIQRPNRGLLELDADSAQRRWKDKAPTKEALKLLKEHGHLLGTKERRLVERGIHKLTTEKLTRLLGPASPKDVGKLAAIRGALVIGDNFAIALMDPSPVLIPFHQVHQILSSLAASNGGKPPRLIRIGTVIKVLKGTWKGTWRVLSVMNSEAYGISVDLARPHEIKKAKGNARIPQMLLDGLEILPQRYTGYPITV